MTRLLTFAIIILLSSVHLHLMSQEVIDLPITVAANADWPMPEKEYYSSIWANPVVSNVSKPSMYVYKASNPNGTAVVICPGGGLYALSIDSEGRDVAKWLAERGVTAFVLKYRLVPTVDDATKEIGEDPNVISKAKKMLSASVSDALNAIEFARSNSDKYGLDKNKIGLIGFSAGGAVTMGATYTYTDKNKPNFIGPIYAWMNVLSFQDVREDAPPLFVVCASDDPLNLAPASVKLYQQWLDAKKPAELHMYSKGGHGFGMKKQNLPSDNWIDRFGDWLTTNGLME